MSSNRNKKTSFIKYYNEIRPILRVYLLDGNKTIDDFIKSEICGCESTYTQLKHKITSFLGTYMKERWLPLINKKVVSLPENMFEFGYNYLCDTYAMCSSFQGKRIGRIVLIMQILQQNKQGMSITEIAYKLEQYDGSNDNGKCLKSKEIIKELVDLGLIYNYKRKYYLCENILESISDPLTFLDFVSLCRNIIDPYTCGNMIMETAMNYFKYNKSLRKYENPFIISGNYFYQVIDDEIEWKLISAMAENKSVKITYKTQIQEIYPIKIKTDKSSGRRYVYGVNAKNNLRSFYRLDKIEKIILGGNCFEIKDYFDTYYNDTQCSVYGVTIPNGSSFAEIVIHFKEGMHKQIKELFKNSEINKKDLIAKIKLNTVKEIKPWLFKNIDNVYIESDSECGLKEEMIKDIKEWRNMYGIV